MPPDLTFGPYRPTATPATRGQKVVRGLVVTVLVILVGGPTVGQGITDALGITTTAESRARASCSEQWERRVAAGQAAGSRHAWMDDCVSEHVRQHWHGD